MRRSIAFNATDASKITRSVPDREEGEAGSV
jgi:hypothetical protein